MSKAGDRWFAALGLMSGTSLDGIDVAYVRTDGASLVERGPFRCFPYDEDFRHRLRSCLEDARDIRDRDARPGQLSLVEAELTDRHVAAVTEFLSETGLSAGSLDVIGFHGQTVLHKPEMGLTVQIGNAERLAQGTGIDVVYDLRAADCAAGGQGAPLAPAYHAALAARLGPGPVAIVNIGGVSNVTLVRNGVPELAFDCGPGNALIDDWVRASTGQACDLDGRLASSGRVDGDRLAAYLVDPFFSIVGPKSLDRNRFSVTGVSGLSPEDGAATLTAFTAVSIGKARWLLGVEPAMWVIVGGGRRNRTLMEMIAGQVSEAVVPAEAAGIDGDSLEAEAWAYLAVRSLRGLAITFPGTTGVSQPKTGGVLVAAPR